MVGNDSSLVLSLDRACVPYHFDRGRLSSRLRSLALPMSSKASTSLVGTLRPSLLRWLVSSPSGNCSVLSLGILGRCPFYTRFSNSGTGRGKVYPFFSIKYTFLAAVFTFDLGSLLAGKQSTLHLRVPRPEIDELA